MTQFGIVCLFFLFLASATFASDSEEEPFVSDEEEEPFVSDEEEETNAIDPHYIWPKKADPDAFRTITELISSKGYPVEDHKVVTSDGYVLGVQRIPYGLDSSGRGLPRGGPAVLLHHGLTSSAASFVADFRNQSLGFVLADAGYDVWMTNARGNQYSRKHVSISPWSSKFWKFSWNEMALSDLPSTIDYIINATQQEKIFYVGHSMGTTVLFALLSEKPEYNNKIRAGVAMAPAALFGHTKSIIKHLKPLLKSAEFLLTLFGRGELVPDSRLLDKVLVFFCQTSQEICANWGAALVGMTTENLNKTRLHVYLAHHPAGTSVRSVFHYAQLFGTDKFKKYDFGRYENNKVYKQPTPPEYQVEKITAPLALMWALNDDTCHPTDVQLLAQRLKSVVLNYQVPNPRWGHFDFAIGQDANKYVYQKILEVFRTH